MVRGVSGTLLFMGRTRPHLLAFLFIYEQRSFLHFPKKRRPFLCRRIHANSAVQYNILQGNASNIFLAPTATASNGFGSKCSLFSRLVSWVYWLPIDLPPSVRHPVVISFNLPDDERGEGFQHHHQAAKTPNAPST